MYYYSVVGNIFRHIGHTSTQVRQDDMRVKIPVTSIPELLVFFFLYVVK